VPPTASSTTSDEDSRVEHEPEDQEASPPTAAAGAAGIQQQLVYNQLDPQLDGLLVFDPNLDWMSRVLNFGLDGGFGLTGGLGPVFDDNDETQLRLNTRNIERGRELQGGGELQGEEEA
jgi:hypothetical protein